MFLHGLRGEPAAWDKCIGPLDEGVVLEGRGNLGPMDQAQTLNAALERFLRNAL
jgi:hypothetical protein